MKILYVEAKQEVRELFAAQLKSELGCSVVSVISQGEALDILNSDDDVDLVISDLNISKDQDNIIFTYLNSKNAPTPLILLCEYKVDREEFFKSFYSYNPLNRHLPKLCTGDNLVFSIKQILGIDSNNIPEFCEVEIEKMKFFDVTPCDVFLKISDNKYIKIINAKELFDKYIIEKYALKSVTHFYIEGIAYKEFSKSLSRSINEKIAGCQKKSILTFSMELQATAHVHDTVLKLGIGEDTISTIDMIMESSLRQVDKNRDLYLLLKRIQDNQDFLYGHSLLTSYISGALSMQMSWHSRSTLEKLSLASILHDVCLEDVRLAQAEFDDPNELEKLGWKEIKKIKNHPFAISDLVNKSEGLPPDLDTILMAHHEHPDGSGFPRGLNAHNTFPLACLFIISEDISRQIYGKEITAFLIKSVLDKMGPKFNTGNYKQPYQGLVKMLSKISSECK